MRTMWSFDPEGSANLLARRRFSNHLESEGDIYSRIQGPRKIPFTCNTVELRINSEPGSDGLRDLATQFRPGSRKAAKFYLHCGQKGGPLLEGMT